MNKPLTPQQSRFVDEQFSESQPESGYYVYLLINPETGRVFYVGKGVRNRAKSHARHARAGIVDNVKKHCEICAIHSAGQEVRILFRPTETEREAFQVERVLIAALMPTGITNLVPGMMCAEEKASVMAKHYLGRLKSKQDWVNDLTPEMKASAAKVFGSVSECYDFVARGLVGLSCGGGASHGRA